MSELTTTSTSTESTTVMNTTSTSTSTSTTLPTTTATTTTTTIATTAAPVPQAVGEYGYEGVIVIVAAFSVLLLCVLFYLFYRMVRCIRRPDEEKQKPEKTPYVNPGYTPQSPESSTSTQLTFATSMRERISGQGQPSLFTSSGPANGEVPLLMPSLSGLLNEDSETHPKLPYGGRMNEFELSSPARGNWDPEGDRSRPYNSRPSCSREYGADNMRHFGSREDDRSEMSRL